MDAPSVPSPAPGMLGPRVGSTLEVKQNAVARGGQMAWDEWDKQSSRNGLCGPECRPGRGTGRNGWIKYN